MSGASGSLVPVLAHSRRCGRAPEAADFLKFLLSADGQAVLSRYGFVKP